MTAQPRPDESVQWGVEIGVEVVNGVPYRMYRERPRRLESLLGYADRWSERPYLVQGERVLSFAAMRAAVAAKGAELSTLGVGRGDRVFLIGWNSPEWAINFWACLAVGAAPALANSWWSAAEIEAGLQLIDPAVTLADAAAAGKIPPGARLGRWGLPPAGAPPADRPEPGGGENDLAMIIFTSGTSGRAKAVMLSHRAALARLHMTLHITRKLPQQLVPSGADVTLLTGPLFHVGQMQALLRAVMVGDTLVMSGGRFDPAEVLALIERRRVNRWTAVPTMVGRVLDHPDVGARDLSSLKSISIGGAPVHAELMARMRAALPSVSPRVPTGYGLTENGGQATATAGADRPERLGSSGRPLPCVEVGFLVHPGLPDGEILLRAPTQMSGYFGLADSPIDAEGWLHTGDLGRLDEHGALWITGRCKDMIIRGGENIAPAAIEGALMTIPGVVEAAVFGVPHPDLGEEVMAVVVTDAGSDLAGSDLALLLKGKVASFAVPSRWRVQNEALPTNQMGKIDKIAIAASARADLGARSATADGN